ncbi:hypothetical protein ACFFSY_21880 [Paenibacillus aurantiacus]|uniref:Uncharacterized protein n=1 Tax=Paenibacillus aurantiacus TaxID=1936118 RepID=A0ABV5KWJ0_9BACL
MRVNRIARSVEFGYEPPTASRKGTLIYYDAFEHVGIVELNEAATYAEKRHFEKFVLYPIHEETAKRMGVTPVRPYHKRLDDLHEWKRDTHNPDILVEGLDGKRKKYTPIDSALRHMTEIYPKPFFLLMTSEMANRFASYASFDEWITKLRLVLTDQPDAPHPKLQQASRRWNTLQDESEA